jgi:hypothetical protein
MSRKAFFVFLLALCALLTYADDAKGGLIDGDNWAILVSAPEGWIWDSVALRSQGILGLFYKKGECYSPSRLHIYISPTAKIVGGPASLSEFIEADESAFMSSDTDLLVKDLAPYSPGVGYHFAMRELDDSDNGYYQTLAYYEGEKAFFVFVLSCRSSEERERERGALLELLDSFTYISKE